MHQLLRNNTLTPVDSLPTALLYGYSVYTSFRWPLPERWLAAHLARLHHDAAALGIPLALGLSELQEALAQVPGGQAIRMTVLPEITGFPDLFDTEVQASRVLLSCRTLLPPSPKALKLKIELYESPLANLKHGSLGETLALKRRAILAGYDDVLRVDPRGHILEAATANIFFIQGQMLLTPDPALTPCLPGIMRAQVLNAAEPLGILCRERTFSLSELDRTDGAFLTNAVQGLVRVAAIDERTLPWPTETDSLFERLRSFVCPSAEVSSP